MSFDWIPAAIAVVVFLGAAAVYLRGSRDKGTIETLERNNAALSERVTLLEASDTAKGVKIEALTQANEVLTNTVNSSDLIKGLQTDLLKHHTAAMSGMQQIHSDLAALPAELAQAIREDKR